MKTVLKIAAAFMLTVPLLVALLAYLAQARAPAQLESASLVLPQGVDLDRATVEARDELVLVGADEIDLGEIELSPSGEHHFVKPGSVWLVLSGVKSAPVLTDGWRLRTLPGSADLAPRDDPIPSQRKGSQSLHANTIYTRSTAIELRVGEDSEFALDIGLRPLSPGPFSCCLELLLGEKVVLAVPLRGRVIRR